MHICQKCGKDGQNFFASWSEVWLALGDVARFWAPGTSNHNGRPWQNFWASEKITFTFVRLGNLKVIERRKWTCFDLKYLFCRPLGFTARGGRTTLLRDLLYPVSFKSVKKPRSTGRNPFTAFCHWDVCTQPKFPVQLLQGTLVPNVGKNPSTV